MAGPDAEVPQVVVPATGDAVATSASEANRTMGV
jgi:hypothetical protein